MNPVDRAKQMVFGYNENPENFTDEQAERIAHIAAKLGLPFRPESKALKKFFFDLVDNMTFGALPDDMRPVSRGQSVYGETKGEKTASNLALLGLLVPGAAGAKAGAAGARAIMKRLPTKTQEIVKRSQRASNAIGGAASFGGATAAMNLLEDPMGAPERAFAGAALGGALGTAGLLKYAMPTNNRLESIIYAGGNTLNRRLPGYSGLLQGSNPIYL